MPTEVIRTLKTDGSGDYTTISAWESGRQGDFVSADEIDVLECYSGSTSESFFVAGSTTDETRYREIRAAVGHEHNGDFAAGFKVASSVTGSGPIRPFDHHIHIIGIVIDSGAMTSGSLLAAGGGTSVPEMWVGGCLLNGNGVVTVGLGRSAGSGTDRYWNNIITGLLTDSFATGILANQGTSTFHIYNNTVIGGVFGIWRVDGTARIKNNIAQGATNACFSGTMTDSATNISSDATSPQTGLRNISLTFEDAANLDYHLAATDTAAIDAGTDLSADANLAFSIDIDGDARPSGAWDIGADEFVSAAVTEAISPNTVLATANLQDTSLNAPPLNTMDIDEDPASPDGNWWTAVNPGLDIEARVGFPTPSTGTPTGTQTFYIWARKTSGTQNPTIDVELWEAGSFVATLLNDVEITSTTGQLLTATFNTAGSPPSLTNPTGEDAEIRIVATAGIAE